MSANRNEQTNQIITYATLVALLALGFWLRWRFIHTVHLYPDEFVTLLAIRMISQKGLPVMPSGLFYEHGLLYSYAGSLAALLGPAEVWARYVSLLFGMLTIGLTFHLGRRWFSPAAGLIAAAGLVIAPAAIQWSGRVRMYALLQLFVLLTLWLAYEGITRDSARRRWAALLAYLGAMLTHFVAVALAPPLAAAAAGLWWLRGVEERGSGPSRRLRAGAGEQPFQEASRGSGGAEEHHSPISQSFNPSTSLSGQDRTGLPLFHSPYLEALAFLTIVVAGFLVKRLGQPKGIDPLETSEALTGIAQVFAIYSNFSFNLLESWQAVAPFYLTLPALIFAPFALLVVVWVGWKGGRMEGEKVEESPNPPLSHSPNLPISPTLFLALILILTTLEMFFVSPDRRDDKYLFMLLPVLLLLGAQGMVVIGGWLWREEAKSGGAGEQPFQEASHGSGGAGEQPFQEASRRSRGAGNSVTHHSSLITYHAPRTTHHAIRNTQYASWVAITLIILLILFSTKPHVEILLANTGDDYKAAFDYVKTHWQPGDKIMTGTPAAAVLYLGRNDFYGVQKRGGYDYRLLAVDGQTADRWLASPAVRTEADLHRTLAENNVWLVLERWGLQREYYDLPFQQQLLAQTEARPEAEAQGIFVLRSKANPQPLATKPAHPVTAVFGEQVQLLGYTVEPEPPTVGQSLRLTLYWQALAPVVHNYTVFAHLRDARGNNVAQADHRPLGDLYPTTLWPVGETIRESSELYLPPDLPPGEYTLWTGLYLFETGQRLPVRNDTSGENAVKLGVVEIVSNF